jgi:hypothetical protein
VGRPAADEAVPRAPLARLVERRASSKELVAKLLEKAVLYRSKLNPFQGRNFEAMDPVEWLARMSEHIPIPDQHRAVLRRVRHSRTRAVIDVTRRP